MSRVSRTAQLRNTAAWLCLCFYPAGHAQTFTRFAEWLIPTSGSGPTNVAPTGGSGMYFTELNSGKIGFLDMNTNLLTEFTLPAGAFPRGLAVQGQRVAFAEGNSYIGSLIGRGKIALLDSATYVLTEWSIPQITPGTSAPAQVSMLGPLIFFSDSNQGTIGMLDTSTNLMTQWLLPGAPVNRSPNGIVVVSGPGSAIEVWAADALSQKISLLMPATNTFTEWAIPDLSGDETLQHLDIQNGVVAFQEANFNFVATLTTANNVLREWQLPTGFSQPFYVAWLSPGVLAFSEYSTGRIGTLNVAVGPSFQTAVVPTRMGVAPNVQPVAPAFTVLPPMITAAAPVIRGATRIVTAGFIEYPIPTEFSQPAGLAPGAGGIVFAEFSNKGNRIGLLH